MGEIRKDTLRILKALGPVAAEIDPVYGIRNR